ncbi:uncharacterized protein LOC131069095 isoform X2 [Cryptomeria japonica]|uniref:uncharacterized protein LOC131069095 isoform X2 n=1 Tax=Cryptomeria japonica TaxID=3369 RepID=UPI0027DA8731|nr:uncharacterized protein LOC131069095 isoform X2 [Cryptomeria japonica]
MEKSMLKRSQITCIPGISRDHKKWYSESSIKPISCGYGGNYSFKGTSVNLPLHSILKPTLFTGKGLGITNKRGLLWVNVIRATTSSSINGGDDAPDQSKQYNSVFSVFAGIFGFLIRLSRGILGVLYREKKTFERIEDKVENAVEIVEEVADTVKDVAEVTEEIAEKIEKLSKEGDFVHETAEFVDEISERVGRDAGIVENQVETIKKTIKSMDEEVDKAEDAVKDITEKISEENVSKEDEKEMGRAENSSIPTAETEKDNKSMDSVEVTSKSKFEVVGFMELLRRFTWLLFWARRLSPMILGVLLVVIFGEQLIGTFVTCYSQFMAP